MRQPGGEFLFSDTPSQRWAGLTGYESLLEHAEWYRRKYDRLVAIAWRQRRFSRPLVDLSLPEIEALEQAGRSPSGRPGVHQRELATDEGFGYARAYLVGIQQLERMTPVTREAIHTAIRHGARVAGPTVKTVPGGVASAYFGLAGGGSIATDNAMRTVRRYRATFILD